MSTTSYSASWPISGLQPGDRLPSTTELAEIANVSGISVRRALDELERAGKITRRQGLGTFVAEPRIASDPTRPGELLHTLLDKDRGLPAVTTALISIGVGLPSTTIATALGVDPGQPVWEIWRKRSIGSTDKILERAVLPLSRVPAIDQDLLAKGESLYRFIEERYQLTDEYTEQAFEVDTPSSWEAEQLEVPHRGSDRAGARGELRRRRAGLRLLRTVLPCNEIHLLHRRPDPAPHPWSIGAVELVGGSVVQSRVLTHRPT